MVVLAHHHLHRPLPQPATRSKKLARTLIPLSSSAISQPSLDFPYLPAPQRSRMTSLLATVETHLAALLPPSLPPDVQRFQSPSGAFKGCPPHPIRPKGQFGCSATGFTAIFRLEHRSTSPPPLLSSAPTCSLN